MTQRLIFIWLTLFSSLGFAQINDCPNPGGFEGQRRCAHQLCLTQQMSVGCWEEQENRDLWRACAGSLDGLCVREACFRMQGFDACDKRENALKAAALCRLVDGDCVMRHCEYGINCNDFAELEEVIRTYCRLDF